MITVQCVNEGCKEKDIVKPCNVTLMPGEPVICGACGEHCQQNAEVSP